MMKTTKKLKNNTPKTNGALAEPVKQPAFKAEPVKAAPSQAELLKPAPVRPEPVKAAVVRPEPPKPAPVKTEAAKPIQLKAEPVPAPVIKSEPAKPVPVKPESPAVNRVPLQLEKPGAKSVCVAGSFNGWNPAKTPLRDAGNGKWVGELTGISGRHEYMFVVDGQWLPDPNARETVQNPFGGRNSVLVASA